MIRAAQGVARTAGGRPFREAGFSLTGLVVFIAVVGVLFVMSVPFFVRYYQAAAARADVQQVITLFNQARSLAVRQNDTVCVTMPTSAQMALRLSNCAGAVWTGPGTDGTGNINLLPPAVHAETISAISSLVMGVAFTHLLTTPPPPWMLPASMTVSGLREGGERRS